MRDDALMITIFIVGLMAGASYGFSLCEWLAERRKPKRLYEHHRDIPAGMRSATVEITYAIDGDWTAGDVNAAFGHEDTHQFMMLQIGQMAAARRMIESAHAKYAEKA